MDKNFDVKFLNYGLEIILDNEDTIIFTLLYSQKYGISLFQEDKPLSGDISPDDIISNINEDEIIKEIFILDFGINILDVTGQRKYLPINIKKIKIFNNSNDNLFTIVGDLIKYNKETARKYNLDELHAYDYYISPIKIKKNF